MYSRLHSMPVLALSNQATHSLLKAVQLNHQLASTDHPSLELLCQEQTLY